MNLQKTSENQKAKSGSISGFVKLYAHGKLGLVFNGDRRFIKAAEQCFAKSIRIILKFDHEEFEAQMRKHGIPANIIDKFAEGYSLDDDIWLSTGSNWPN